MCDDLRGVGFPDRVMIEDEARVELRLREDALLNPLRFPSGLRQDGDDALAVFPDLEEALDDSEHAGRT
jgi:hypothetical protein